MMARCPKCKCESIAADDAVQVQCFWCGQYFVIGINFNKIRKASIMPSTAGVPSILVDDEGGTDFAMPPAKDNEAMLDVPVKPKRKRVVRAKITRTHHENKLAEVPPRSVFDNYVDRSYWGMTAMEIFAYATKTASNVLLKGPTGSGKTMAVQAYAAGKDRPYYSISSSAAAEPQQIFGKLLPTGHGNELAWFDGSATDIFRYGGVLLINEVNFMPRAIASILFSTLDSRRVLQLVDHKGEVIKAHRPDCWCDLPAGDCESRWVTIFADMNPGYQGTWELNEAFLNRFGVQLDWDYDPNVESQLIASQSLLDFANKVRRDDSTRHLTVPFSTNMMLEFETALGVTGNFEFAKGTMMAKFPIRDRTFVDTLWNTFAGNIINDYTNLGAI